MIHYQTYEGGYHDGMESGQGNEQRPSFIGASDKYINGFNAGFNRGKYLKLRYFQKKDTSSFPKEWNDLSDELERQLN